MTMNSTKALEKLGQLDEELAKFREELGWYKEDIDDPESQMSQLVHVRNKSHQFQGHLEKFQYVKVDAVTTSDLTTGKEQAREMRKRINRECEEIREEMISYAAKLEARIQGLKEMAEEQQQRDGSRSNSVARPSSTRQSGTGLTIQEDSTNWLDELPTASDSLQIQMLRSKSIPSPFGKADATLLSASSSSSHRASLEMDASDSMKSLHNALSRDDSRMSAVSAEGDDNEEHVDDTNPDDGELYTPEWGQVQAFANLHVPNKPSSTRYSVSMRSANLTPDRTVLDFLFTPAAHAHSLRLSDRPLSMPEVDILGRLFSSQWHHACKLRELRLNNMMLTDLHIKKLSPYLADFPTLETLQLTDNKITDTGVYILSQHLRSIKTLTELCLDGNSFKANGAVALAKAVKKLPLLMVLSVSHNNIGDYGAYAISEALLVNTPASFEWEPDVPLKPAESLEVEINFGRENTIMARQSIAALSIASTFSGGPDRSISGGSRFSLSAMAPPPPPGSSRAGSDASSRMSVVPGPPGALPKSRAIRGTIAPPPPGRPPTHAIRGTIAPPPPGGPPPGSMPRMSMVPPPPGLPRGVGGRKSVIRQSLVRGRMSTQHPGLKGLAAGAGPPPMMRDSDVSGAGGYLSMTIEEDENEDEDEDGEEDGDKVNAGIGPPKSPPKRGSSSIPPPLPGAGGRGPPPRGLPPRGLPPPLPPYDGPPRPPGYVMPPRGLPPRGMFAAPTATSAKDRIKAAKEARDEAERVENMKQKVKRLWSYFKICCWFLGRFKIVQRGDVPLSVLNCANCGITSLGVQWLFHAVKFNENIASLNLSDNKITYESAIVIAEYLMWCESLDELILDGNSWEEEGIHVLLKGVEMNKSLSSLSLDRCNLGSISLNWIASTTHGFYIDNVNLVKDKGLHKSARMKLEDYVDDVKSMGHLIEDLHDEEKYDMFAETRRGYHHHDQHEQHGYGGGHENEYGYN
jgi:Ran GTPase-activating protein (RanGAP) involved in mRNA processing and transport